MKTKAKKCLSEFNKKSRMYKYPISGRASLYLLKIWNNGMGSLEGIRIYPEKLTILVNSAVWTKRDERVLQSILAGLGMRDWNIESRYYGYPRYYNNIFGLHLPD